VQSATATPSAPASTNKKAANAAGDEKTDDNATAANGTVAPAAPAPASPSPPAAAILIPNTVFETAPGYADGTAATGAIGTQTRGKADPSRLDGQLSHAAQPGQTPQSGGPTTQPAPNTTTATADIGAGKPGPSPTAAAGPTTPGNAPVSQTPTADTTAPQGEIAASPAASLATAHLGAALTVGPPASSNAQTATDTVKSATAGLPNFGIVATNIAATQATAAAGPATSAAAVSIAGLPVAIAARAQAGSNQFDIRLDPPELGRIDVRLDVDSSGQVTSHVTVDRPETLTLLQSQQPQLERALEQAGLKTTENGLQFSLRDQSFAGQNNGGGNAQPGPAQQLVIPDANLPPVDTTQIYSRFGVGGGIDITV